ncbi:hypothetical protein VTK73DRAFT_1384 [Phialemonium thermophilum]|uniref:Uncharacterized protein n=1 Tax=Phialemonium thermophilum TaxID=223376 RepID=A0ABR3VTP8_9PEZI
MAQSLEDLLLDFQTLDRLLSKSPAVCAALFRELVAVLEGRWYGEFQDGVLTVQRDVVARTGGDELSDSSRVPGLELEGIHHRHTLRACCEMGEDALKLVRGDRPTTAQEASPSHPAAASGVTLHHSQKLIDWMRKPCFTRPQGLGLCSGTLANWDVVSNRSVLTSILCVANQAL